MAQAPKTTLPKYNARRGLWVGGDSRTLYTFTDPVTGHKTVTQGTQTADGQRAQGGEWHTVLFDPVDGKNSFFHGKSARRLVNVAMSRTKARFLVTLSQTDCQNVILRELSVAIAEQEILAA
jgi:hypothetical protein